jgi:acyl-CoA thioester hydrolase
MDSPPSAHPTHTTRWAVRTYELDVNGHVNNSTYLAYAEEVATQHAELLGFGRAWATRQGGAWVVRRHEITYYRPALYQDELELTTRVEQMKGARGIRRTSIRLVDGSPVAEVVTEWAWVRSSDGRPTRIPREVHEAFVLD